MTNIAPRPEDAFPMDALVGTSEVVIAPLGGTTGTVPTRKNKRCIYVLVLGDSSGAANWIELRIYTTATPPVLDKAVKIPIPANDTVRLLNRMDSPVYTVPANRTLKAIANADSVQVHAEAYDL